MRACLVWLLTLKANQPLRAFGGSTEIGSKLAECARAELASSNLRLAGSDRGSQIGAVPRPDLPTGGCGTGQDEATRGTRSGEWGTTLLRCGGGLAPRPLPQLRLYMMSPTSVRGV